MYRVLEFGFSRRRGWVVFRVILVVLDSLILLFFMLGEIGEYFCFGVLVKFFVLFIFILFFTGIVYLVGIMFLSILINMINGRLRFV